MRTIPAALQAHITKGRTTLATLWRVSRVRDALNVVSVSAASEAVVTTEEPHGLSANDSVRMVLLGGTVSAMNKKIYRVTSVISETEFSINFNSTGLTHAASSGKVQKTFGFTNSVVDLDFENVTYRARSGTFPTQKKQTGDGAVGNMEITVLPVAPFEFAQVYGGLWDGARTSVFIVNYRDLSMGSVELLSGWLGTVSVRDNEITFELRDLAQALQQEIGDQVTPYCRAELGDAKCKVDLTPFTILGSVTNVTNSLVFGDSASAQTDNYFTDGKIRFTSGENKGVVADIVAFSSKTFTLAYRLPGAVVVGDTYEATIGCNKKIATCKNVFNNVSNFRGEPYVPLPEQVLKYGQNI